MDEEGTFGARPTRSHPDYYRTGIEISYSAPRYTLPLLRSNPPTFLLEKMFLQLPRYNVREGLGVQRLDQAPS